jgi:hypothetical protein
MFSKKHYQDQDELTDERVPYYPCWLGAISEIEIEEPQGEGMSDGEYEAWLASNPLPALEPVAAGSPPRAHVQTPAETSWAIHLLAQYGCTFPNFKLPNEGETED